MSNIDLARHSDDSAVDATAAAMKARLGQKRAEGYWGWDDPVRCPEEILAKLLVGAVLKGNAIDVANFAMMLHQRRAAPAALTFALVNHCTAATKGTSE